MGYGKFSHPRSYTMRNVSLIALVPIVAASMVACGETNTATESASSAVSSVTSSAAEMTKTTSSASEATSNAMAPAGEGQVIVEVDGAPVEGNFVPITCRPDVTDGTPELNIESPKGQPEELDIDINNPDETPTLDSLDLRANNIHLETEDQQEMAAMIEKSENTWTVETGAFQEGTQQVSKVKVKVTC